MLDNTSSISTARPELPDGLNDRAADIWEPLFVLADLAGGGWPSAAREAATAISAQAIEANPFAALLVDIYCYFLITKEDRTFSRDLVDYLNDQWGRPWSDARAGKSVNEYWLADQLRPYGIRSRTLWIGSTCAKGYEKDDFHGIFKRYITQAEINEITFRVQPPSAAT